MLWKQGEFSITVPEDDFPLIGPHENLYLITFLSGTPLEKALLQSSALRSLREERNVSLAVVSLNSKEEVTHWANLAHDSSSFACGNIQRIPFAASLREETVLTPPVYHSAIKIPEVADLVDSAKLEDFEDNLTTLTSVGSRYHTTQSGLEVSATIKDIFDAAAGNLANYTSSLVVHSGSDQNSVVATIAGETDTEKTVVIGSHLDSINPDDENDAPGSDDNASGVATLAEVLRILKDAGVKFDRNVELHAYAAEEVGLIGSGEIAENYAEDQKNVVAMLQVDMNTYSATDDDDTIYLVSTDTSTSVRRSAKDIIKNYLNSPYEEKKLAGGTSDHKSWFTRGFPTVFPFENPGSYNPHIHSASDTVENGPNRALPERFVKLILGFLAHYAGMHLETSNYATLYDEFSTNLGHDLKLALIPTEFGGRYYIGVSAPSDISEVEVCIVNSETEMECAEERVLSPLAGNSGSRAMFIDDVALFDLENQEKLRVMGYKSGSLASVRNVQLTEK
ncbi:MAG: M20/M25/M40 family metallo-hydrolase [Oligoflexales bacterium]